MSREDSSPLQGYLTHLENGELAYQYSPAAGRPVFYPRVACPYTGSEDLEWRVSSGRGVVYSTTTVHPPGGDPYNVSLIDCREGFRMMSRVDGIPSADIRIGMEVELRIIPPSGEEPAMPVFVPVEG
ncbi:Zn-ribbon domain-containing OB-fold protein [Neorhizobium tomejilense]|uniref:Zn-ribbon domain-containing OB-fold protein n=1 Tax=Neorhizobium tomejilense TaxID=2093828 RepID=UPI003ECC5BB7